MASVSLDAAEEHIEETALGEIAEFLPIASGVKPVYVRVVSPIDHIIEDLKSLPPDKLELAADYVRRPKPISREEREAILARTAGCLSPEEADQMERIIEEGCEQINEQSW